MVADSLLGLGGRAAEPATTALRRFEAAPLAPAFAVQLVQRLRDQDPVVTPALRWLEERLAAQGTTADDDRPGRTSAASGDERDRPQCDHQHAPHICRSTGRNSSRASVWSMHILRADTDFAALDFATRDRYRHAIEELSRGSQHSELEVAQRSGSPGETLPGPSAGSAASLPWRPSRRIPATTSSRKDGSLSSESSASAFP